MIYKNLKLEMTNNKIANWLLLFGFCFS